MIRPCSLGLLVFGLLGCQPVVRGQLVVVSDLGNAQLKSVELQHQDRAHAEAVTGFEPGKDTVHYEVIVGPYCVERLLFDTGPAGGVVMPTNMCFEVGPDGPTEIRVIVTEDGQVGMMTDHSVAPADQGPPPAGPD